MTDANPRCAVAVLAAGKGTRMRSERPKVLHELAGRPLLDHVIDLALAVARPHDVIVVVGHGAEAVIELIRGRGVTEAVQEPPLGTGDALRVACAALEGRPTDRVVVLSGDVPLLRPETIERLLAELDAGATASLATVELDEPGSYGRVIRGDDGLVARTVEAGDASPDELAIREVNVGTYAFSRPALTSALTALRHDNVQGEYYLTDVAALLAGRGLRVRPVVLDDLSEMQGVNDRADLAAAERALNARVLAALMASGVTVRDPGSVWVDPRAEVGRDAVLDPGVVLRGACRVGAGARIGANSVLVNAAVAADEIVRPLSYLTGE